MKSLGGGNKAIDTIKSPHKRETFYEIRNIAHKKENKENIKERLFSQPHCLLAGLPDYSVQITGSETKFIRIETDIPFCFAIGVDQRNEALKNVVLMG